MVELWLLILAPLWFLWGMSAVVSVLLIRKLYRRRILPGTAASLAAHRPFALVIVPFKGVDVGMAASLDGLFGQDYPAYRLALVVDSADDPAAAMLREAMARHPAREAELLVAGRAPPTTSQKIHNQLHALAACAPRLAPGDALVFADSDACPSPRWLGKLVGPLCLPEVGCTTGYRWLVPAADRLPPSLWTCLASILNASAATFLGRHGMDMAWGGAMALNAGAARALGLERHLRGRLTDDYQVTRMVKSAGLQVLFVPECLVASPTQFTCAAFLNFLHRQYLITRVYSPWHWGMGIFITGVYTLGLATALAALAHGALRGPGWLHLAPAAALLVVALADPYRVAYRRRILRAAFGEAVLATMARVMRVDLLLTWLWMPLNLLLLLRAGVGRTMVWRGIRYRLRGRQDVERLGG